MGAEASSCWQSLISSVSKGTSSSGRCPSSLGQEIIERYFRRGKTHSLHSHFFHHPILRQTLQGHK